MLTKILQDVYKAFISVYESIPFDPIGAFPMHAVNV